MKIYPVPAFTDNYIWLLTEEKNRSAVCVDPGDADPVIRFLEEHNFRLDAILLTHHHADHIGGLDELLTYQPTAAVFAPKDSRISSSHAVIKSQETVTLAHWQFQVIPIPGHTSSHICYYEPEYGLLFCGDTLFSAGCGRVFDGTMEQLHDSLARIMTLPDDTKVYCGHEYTRQNLLFAATVEPNNTFIYDYYNDLMQDPERCSLPSTIELEKRINPFVRLKEPSVIAYAKNRGCPNLDSLSVFRQLREDKNNF
jgi:hydroxyacylglutathione hydrolase